MNLYQNKSAYFYAFKQFIQWLFAPWLTPGQFASQGRRCLHARAFRAALAYILGRQVNFTFEDSVLPDGI